MTKAHQIVAIIAGLLAIVTGLSTYLGMPLPSLLLFSKHTVSRSSSNPQFSIETIKTNSNVAINSGDSFSYKFSLPLSARGVTKLLDKEVVWVVLVNESGNYFLQFPPVTIRNGQWIATNIRPLEGIKRIIFWRVGINGDKFLRRKVEHDEWGKFNTMPPDASEVAFVELE